MDTHNFILIIVRDEIRISESFSKITPRFHKDSVRDDANLWKAFHAQTTT